MSRTLPQWLPSVPKMHYSENIEDSKIEFPIRKKIGMPKACQRISKIKANLQFSEVLSFENNLNANETWYLLIDYPEEVKIITQSRDVDIHSLIGNIGGYLGLFLGN